SSSRSHITKPSRYSGRGDTAEVERRRARRKAHPLTGDICARSGRPRGGGRHRQPSARPELLDQVVIVTVAAGVIVSSISFLVDQHAEAGGEHIHLLAHEESISPSGASGDIALPTVELPGPVAGQGDIPRESADALGPSLAAGPRLPAPRDRAEETARRP